MSHWRFEAGCLLALSCAALGACGGGGGSSTPPPPPTFTVAGTMSGLSNPLVLQITGRPDLTVVANGSVTFMTGVANGTAYAVSVRTQPTSPHQDCTVTNGTGTVITNVSNISIQCVDIPLSLTASTPANAAPAAARDGPLSLTFSLPIDASLPASAITLQNADDAIPLTFTVSGNQVTVTPAQRLLPVMAHTLTVGTAIRGTGGEQMAAPAVVSFTTADGVWGQPHVFPVTTIADEPSVAFDTDGHAMAIWRDSDLGRHAIKSLRYIPGAGWDPFMSQATLVPIGFIGWPKFAFDGAGGAMAVWGVHDAANDNLHATRYIAGAGWESNGGGVIQYGDSTSPELAVDPAGNAMVVWNQYDGTRHDVRARRYTAGVGWGTAHLIEIDNQTADGRPQVEADANGNFIAVWIQTDGVRNNVWANRYVAGTGWSGRTLIETDNGNAISIVIDVHESGEAIAIWEQNDGVRDNLWASRYVAGNWTATLIETGDGNVQWPQVAYGANGDAIAVWTQTNQGAASVYANRYVAGSGWSGATLIETDDAGNANAPKVAVDRHGHAIVVWNQHDGTGYNFVLNRFVAGRGWGTATLLETDEALTKGTPDIAIDHRGDAIAVWSQYDGTTYRLRARRFE
jgi:hypothetical protein